MKEKQNKGITLYSSTTCQKCRLAADRMSKREIAFEKTNIDFDEEAREKLLALGLSSLPILEKDGEMITDFAEIMNLIEEEL